MKQFLLDYSLNVVIAIILLMGASFLFDTAKALYYTYSPLDSFYERGEFIALDVCVGDENQSIMSTRTVKGTDLGYSAVVTRELFNIANDKILEETVSPFVDVAGNGKSQRIQRLPTWLPAGEYYWVLYVKLNVYSVTREVIPPLVSTTFRVVECN